MRRKNTKIMSPKDIARDVLLTCVGIFTRTSSPQEYVQTLQNACDFLGLIVTIEIVSVQPGKVSCRYVGNDSARAMAFVAEVKKCGDLGDYEFELEQMISCLQRFKKPEPTLFCKIMNYLKGIFPEVQGAS